MPIAEKANSVMLLRPMTTAPAARSRATATASALAGAASRRTFEPAVVTSPAMSKRSLIETGRPASGDGTTPCFRSRSEASAATSAPWACTLVKTRPPSPPASAMRASAASTSLRLVVLPSASSCASAAIGRRTTSAMGLPWRLALRGLVVIVHLEQKATRFRLERPVRRSRRAARIRIGTEARAAFAVPVVADDQIARDEIHLFPVVVHERLGRMHAGGEAQMSRAETTLVLLVEESREHLLPDPVGITGQFFPAAVEVHFVELLVLFLDCHGVSC